jgi:DNA-binding MarR family transcriptional regulator
LIDLLSDGRAWRLRDLEREAGPYLRYAIDGLIADGVVARAGYGTYALSSAARRGPAPWRPSAAHLRVLALIGSRPLSVAEIRRAVRRTRQAVHNVLARLEAAGLAFRLAGRGQSLFVADPAAAAYRAGVPALDGRAARLLSALPAAGAVAVRVLAPGFGVGPVLGHLESLGLVRTRRGKFATVQLTEIGLAHPQWSASADKAPQTDSFGADGRWMAALAALSVLGKARAADLGAIVGSPAARKAGARWGAGHFVYAMDRAGFVEPAGPGGRGRMYRLTDAGRERLAAAQAPLPSLDEITARLPERHPRRILPPRTIPGPAGKRLRMACKTAAVLQLLRDRGPLPVPVIQSLLPQPYATDEGLHNALLQMRRSGFVSSARMGGSTRLEWAAAV